MFQWKTYLDKLVPAVEVHCKGDSNAGDGHGAQQQQRCLLVGQVGLRDEG